MNDLSRPDWKIARLAALAVGVAAGCGCGLLARSDVAAVLRSYLIAYFVVYLVTTGCLGLLALGNLTGGKWAVAARPVLSAGADTTLLVAVLFAPIALGVRHVYVWAESPNMFAGMKGVWLSHDFFLGRSAAYLGVWLAIAWAVVRVSSPCRPPGESTLMRRMGAIGLVLLILVVTLAAFDWGMSLEPQWYSSIYGALLAISGVVAAQAIVALVLCRAPSQALAPFYALAGGETLHRLHDADAAAEIRGDVGNLLLALVMLWAYFSFSQFLIIWSGNLPSEIAWYLPRIEGGWQWLAIGIAALHFAAPFLLLFSRRVKRSAAALAGVSVLLIVMYIANLFWTIKPAFSPRALAMSGADAACLLAVGGIWTAAFLWRLHRRWLAVEVLASARIEVRE